MLLKTFCQPFSALLVSQLFLPVSDYVLISILSASLTHSRLIHNILAICAQVSTYTQLQRAAERRHHQPHRSIMVKPSKHLRYYFFVRCREQDLCAPPYLGLIISWLYCWKTHTDYVHKSQGLAGFKHKAKGCPNLHCCQALWIKPMKTLSYEN